MSNPNCTVLYDNLNKVRDISPHIKGKTSQASVLMLLNAILMGLVVVIGAYAPRSRRHPVIGAVFQGATALFLPIVSIIVTTTGSVHDLIQIALKDVSCFHRSHLRLVFTWTGVVVVIGINITAVVAGDAREGRNIAPPILLLVKASWSAYLTFSTLYPSITLVQLFVIMFAKLLLKYAAFCMAWRSFALGRSPRLIAGYMAQLQQQPVHDEHTPALIVMGEDKVQVEEQPHGYSFKEMQMPNQQQGDTVRENRNRLLVTLDRVFGLDEDDDMGSLQTSSTTTTVRQGKQNQVGDLCLSFALFKLLRCRFAKYTVSEAGLIKISKFFRDTLLRGDDHERVFGIVRDELSFLNDYYYSSLPIYYSHALLPALGVTLSLCSIGYCLYLVLVLVDLSIYLGDRGQVYCWLRLHTQDCNGPNIFGPDNFRVLVSIGSSYYDIVPLYLAIAVLLLAEAREIVSYICSNWTKVALIYHHVNQVWWQRSRVVQKCIFALVNYRRCKLVNNWDDKMKQCSILVLRPRRTPLRLRHLLRFVGAQRKVKVPNDVKAAIFRAIKGESFTTEQWPGLCNTTVLELIPPPPSPFPAVYDNGKHPAAYSILVWHIATSVFEVSSHQSRVINASQLPQPSKIDNKTVATHLSRYCAYLMTSHPELLPDDAKWCCNLYDEVKKDADRVLANKVQQGVDLSKQLIQVLSADSNHEVLRNGARLGEELGKDSAMGWENLARFWVQMILYVAPSENLEAHAEAISHGGELITLLWAMLAHAGVTGRRLLDDAGVGAAAEEGRWGVC